MLTYNLNKKTFVTLGNPDGLASSETLFHYFQKGSEIFGNYSGGEILKGQLVGKALSLNRIQMLFQCLTSTEELLSGRSIGMVDQNEDGLIRLSFNWNLFTGDISGGISSYIELPS